MPDPSRRGNEQDGTLPASRGTRSGRERGLFASGPQSGYSKAILT
jgi:hypothetical protein